VFITSSGVSQLRGEPAAADDGRLRPELVETLAHVLLASLNEVSLLIAGSHDQAAAMKAGADTIDELLRRLLA
jgi:hypothetical protein